jgi:autotransporter-associated beta strand protein
LKKIISKVVLLFCFFAASKTAFAQTNFATLATDGGWCWFSDPRAIFHNGTLFFGCVRSDGHSALNEFNLQTGTMTNLWISSLTEFDDHDVCGMQVRQDNTLLALWSRHGGDTFFSYRQSTSTNPVLPADWSAEQTANTTSGETYCNPHQLSAESGKIYSFSRDLNYNPTVFTSSDNGNTWSAPTLMIKTGTGSTRPYVKYCSNYSNRIDILYTDAHPDNYTTSLYELYYQSNAFYRTDGSFVTNFSQLPILHDSGQRGSVVYQYSDAASTNWDQWIQSTRAWCWEMACQTNGAPVCVFQAKGSTPLGDRIYYYYARWTGTNWQKKFIAQAGRPLYSSQPDYGGGIGLDPADINTVYFSSDAASPLDLTTTTNVALGAHYEIYKGVTTNGGLNFTWSAVTTNSTVDNCRPYVPRRFGGEKCVLWWRGTYNTYTSFYTSIVGLFTTVVPVVTNNFVLSLPATIPPAQIKKANNTTSLNQVSSWLGGNAPNAGNVAVWDNNVTSVNSVSLGANTSWAGILVTNPAGAINITSGNTLTLGASGVDMSGATANLTISSGLTLGAGNQMWNVTNSRTLTLNTGTFSRSSGATLNVQGAGTISSSMTGLANDSSNNGGILGPWATIGSGAVTSFAALAGGNILSYNGGIAVAYNTIPTAATAATNYVITSAGSVAYGAATRTVNTLALTSGATTLTWGNSGSQINLIVNGILNSGSGLFTLTQGGSSSLSGVMIGANNNRELVLNAANAPITVSARIIDNSGGTSSLTVASGSTNAVTLSGANTHTGGTTLNAGNLVLGNASGLGSTSGALAVNGGMLDLGNFSTTVGAASINGGVIQNGTLTATSFTANNPNSAGVSAVLAGASASLVKNNFGTLALTAQNTYGGATTVNAGTLNLLGGISGSVTVAGGTLSGTGTIGGAFTNQSGGSIAPGVDASSIGTLTINSTLKLQPGSRVLIKISKNGDGVIADALTGMNSLNYGGTLQVTNIGGAAFAAGDTFPIFSAANFSGVFSTLVLPALGANLFWTNNLAVNGSLSVASSVSTVPTNLLWSVHGTNLNLSWPADHTGWRLQAQTNDLSGTNWVDVRDSSLTNNVILPVDANQGSVFYRLIYQ